MRIFRHARMTLALLFSSLALGILLAVPPIARADDVPIIIHKPIIKKDPPKPPKKDGEASFTTAAAVGGSAAS